jgi:hypothetical protein
MADWPNDLTFTIWSPNDSECYRITAQTVLEYHHLRIGVGRLHFDAGILLDNVFTSQAEECDYWTKRINAFAEKGYDDGSPPVCLELCSHLFANRHYEILTRDRNVGILVVCRSVVVVVDEKYAGPRPTPERIPSSD